MQKWVLLAGVPLLIAGWLAYFGLGTRFAAAMSQRLPGVIEKAGGSKVPDAAGYVLGRLFDGMWILSVSLVALLAGVLFWRWVVARLNPKTSFLWGAAGLFILANLWCYAAGQSVLFWLLLRGTTVENQAQFRVKEGLLNEIPDRPVLALVGSSQSQAQFVSKETAELFTAAFHQWFRAWQMTPGYPFTSHPSPQESVDRGMKPSSR